MRQICDSDQFSPLHRLLHQRHKMQTRFDLLLSAALQGSSHAEAQIDGPALDSLGPLLPFLDQGSLALVDRGALALRLEEMRSFCLPKEALRDIASLLVHEDLLG